MKGYIPIFYLIFLLLASSIACNIPVMPAATATPTVDYKATQDKAASTKATEDARRKATSDAQSTVAAQKTATQDSAATATAEQQAKMDAQMATVAARNTADAAWMATVKAGTAQVEAQSTQQAASMLERLKQLQRDGLISSTEGTYNARPDFDQSWAQLGWYQWWRTGFKLEDFVIRAHAYWESASNIADWYSSGCGFVYVETGAENHYASFLGLDGRVHNYRYKGNKFTEMQGGYVGNVDHMKGDAQIMLVVANNRSTFFVNDRKISSFEDQNLGPGDLGLTLNSGTNKGFGTRCRMINIELWILK